MNILDINNIAFEILAYPVSYLELIGTLFGLFSVYFASKANILTWSTGIVNVIFFAALFYQVHLYADMFLQFYFFVVTIYGWVNWKSKTDDNKITESNTSTKILLGLAIMIGTGISGFLFSNIHTYLPTYFETPTSFPYADSFIMVSSIVATIMLAKKKIETWYLWITVDVVATMLYCSKGIYFLSLEYLIFLMLASYGLLNWKKELKNG